jgi:hypothetical protein
MRANKLSNQPYTPYTGELVAGLTPDQQTAFEQLKSAYGSQTPFIDRATELANLGASPLQASAIASYLNPYQNQVVDATMRELENTEQANTARTVGAGYGQGGLFNDRLGVQYGQIANQNDLANAQVLGQLNTQNWNQALAAAQADRAAAAQGAYTFGNLGTTNLQDILAGAQATLGAGNQEQQQYQNILNSLYNQWQIAKAYPYQQIGWAAGIDTGLAGAAGGQSSTTPPLANQMAPYIGAGVSALGAFAPTKAGGGRIAGFADGGTPFEPDIAPEQGYVPSAQMGKGAGPPKPPSVPSGGGSGGGGSGGFGNVGAALQGLGALGSAGMTAFGEAFPEAAVAAGEAMPFLAALAFAGGGSIPGGGVGEEGQPGAPYARAKGFIPTVNLGRGRGPPPPPHPAEIKMPSGKDLGQASEGLRSLFSPGKPATPDAQVEKKPVDEETRPPEDIPDDGGQSHGGFVRGYDDGGAVDLADDARTIPAGRMSRVGRHSHGFGSGGIFLPTPAYANGGFTKGYAEAGAVRDDSNDAFDFGDVPELQGGTETDPIALDPRSFGSDRPMTGARQPGFVPASAEEPPADVPKPFTFTKPGAVRTAAGDYKPDVGADEKVGTEPPPPARTASATTTGAGRGTLGDVRGDVARPPAPVGRPEPTTTGQGGGWSLPGGWGLTNAQKNALMAAGFGLMANRSPFLGQALGEAGITGMSAYQGTLKREEEQRREQAKEKLSQQMADQKVAEIKRHVSEFDRRQTETERYHREELEEKKRAAEERAAERRIGIMKPMVIDRDRYSGQPIYGRMNEKGELLNLDGTKYSPEQKAKEDTAANLQGDEFVETLPKEDQAQVRQAGRYMATIPSPNSRSPQAIRLRNEIFHAYPDIDERMYGAQSGAVRKFWSGTDADTIKSFDVAISHLSTLQQVANALQAGDTQLFSTMKNYFKEKLGYEAPTDFNAVRDLVLDEVVKGIVGSRAGVTEREEAHKRVDRAFSQGQFNSVINRYKELMAGQLGGLRQKFTSTTGMHPEVFDRFLAKEARDELARHGDKPIESLNTGAAAPPAARPPRMIYDNQGNLVPAP